jgi:hypothetical protein
MNKIFQLILIGAFVTSCQNISSDKLTKGQVNSIEDSVRIIIQEVYADSVNIDIDKSLKPLWNSPDFHYFLNGKLFSYSQLKTMEAENLSLIKKQVFNFKKKDIDVINNNCAIAYLQGDLRTTFSNDSTSTSAIAEMIVLKLINNNWKMVSGHESYSCDSK